MSHTKLSHDQRLRRIYLVEELDLSVGAIKSGLSILQATGGRGGHHFLFLLVFSTGVERLMKCLLCLWSLHNNGHFLTDSELRNFGHDIVRLRDAIAATCFSSESLRRPAVQEDLEFLTRDPLLNEFLETLSDFGKHDRYVYMNGINNPENTGEWLDRRWDRIEQMTMPREEMQLLISSTGIDEYMERATHLILVSLERFLRALARTVALSGLDGDARSLGTGVWDFLTIRDEDLGTMQYVLQT